MEQIYALINGGVVENTIIADSTFANLISEEYEHVIRVDELDPRPGVGWNYDSGTETFSNPDEA